MQRMAEEGKICRIIVKDLSRFGREQVEAGRLTQIVYPSLGITFISIQENVNSTIGDGMEMLPFYNIFNEWYAAQTSKKIRAVWQSKAEHGKRVSATVPFGYMKAPENKEQWLRVQELRKHRRRPTATGRQSLFSGLVYCPDCGAKLHFCAAKSLKRNQEFWRCSNYKSGRGECQIHYIRDIVLEQIVLESIRGLADFVKCYESAFLYMLAKKTNLVRQTENKKLKSTS